MKTDSSGKITIVVVTGDESWFLYEKSASLAKDVNSLGTTGEGNEYN